MAARQRADLLAVEMVWFRKVSKSVMMAIISKPMHVAPIVLAHAAATHMKSRDGGAIVFVSSRGALRGEPLAPAYGASKGGLNSLTGSLAQAFGPSGIRVAAVAPSARGARPRRRTCLVAQQMDGNQA